MLQERVERGERDRRQPREEEYHQQREQRTDQQEVRTEDDASDGTQLWQGTIAAGQQAAQIRSGEREEVRHAGEVRQQPVTVKTAERQHLVEDLEVDQSDRHEERLVPRQHVGGEQEERKDEIEVEPAEVGKDTTPA